MQDVSDIEIRQAVISMDSDSRDVRGSIAVAGESVQQVQSIGTDLRPGVRREKAQPVLELLLRARLEPMVITASPVGGQTRALSKVRERQPADRGRRNDISRR